MGVSRTTVVPDAGDARRYGVGRRRRCHAQTAHTGAADIRAIPMPTVQGHIISDSESGRSRAAMALTCPSGRVRTTTSKGVVYGSPHTSHGIGARPSTGPRVG